MDSKPKVLVVSHYFAPKNESASVRVTNLAMGLVDNGWDVDVLTVDANLANPLERRLDLGYDEELLQRVRIISAPAPWTARILYRVRGLRGGGTQTFRAGEASSAGRFQRTLSSFRSFVNRQGLKVVDRSYVKAFSRVSPPRAAYDVVLASWGPRYMVDVGVAVAKRFPEARLVIDVRDYIVRRQDVIDPEALAQQRSIQSTMYAKADGVTAVSRHMLSGLESYEGAFREITNAFEVPSDQQARTAPNNEVLTLYYGGRLYPGRRMDALVLACIKVSQNRPIKVQYAGPDGAAFEAAFHEFGAGGLVENLGMVSRDHSLRLGRGADVAIVLSWNTVEKGVMTAKVYELIASDVPIVVLVTGDHKTSGLAELFSHDPLRKVFGVGGDSHNVDEVARFLVSAADAPVEVRQQNFGPEKYASVSYPHVTRELSNFLRSLMVEDR